ncbi:hypothetical protein CEXT_30201 [Caerostris extrusa]|uniref:Uncharacterized protein n=1 Tax=Caerostris extrusa TaxID=172846 RepID=A0AAV4WTC9_CAEEX|nr:hypothetical protein CEXT_30201 [Caerostris extrusa]
MGYNVEPHLSAITPKVSRARIFASSLSYNDVSAKFPFVCTDTINLINSLTYTSIKKVVLPKARFQTLHLLTIISAGWRKLSTTSLALKPTTAACIKYWNLSTGSISSSLSIYWNWLQNGKQSFKSSPNCLNCNFGNVYFRLELLASVKSEGIFFLL